MVMEVSVVRRKSGKFMARITMSTQILKQDLVICSGKSHFFSTVVPGMLLHAGRVGGLGTPRNCQKYPSLSGFCQCISTSPMNPGSIHDQMKLIRIEEKKT